MTATGDIHQNAIPDAEAEEKNTGDAEGTAKTKLGPGELPGPTPPNPQNEPEQASPDLENESSDDDYDKG